MKRCKRCGVNILDESEICPLCRSVLQQGEGGRDGQADSYPDIAYHTRKLRRICNIGSYCLIMLELILILINYYLTPKIRWSMISGGGILYVIFTIRTLLNSHAGHIRRIYWQVIGLIALMLCIDYSLGFQGWSLEYGLPCSIFALNFIIMLCMVINSAHWQYYLVMQIFAVLLAGVDMVLYLMGTVHNTVLVWIALGISFIFWTGTVMVGGRKAENELKRKFHI